MELEITVTAGCLPVLVISSVIHAIDWRWTSITVTVIKSFYDFLRQSVVHCVHMSKVCSCGDMWLFHIQSHGTVIVCIRVLQKFHYCFLCNLYYCYISCIQCACWTLKTFHCFRLRGKFVSVKLS